MKNGEMRMTSPLVALHTDKHGSEMKSNFELRQPKF